MGEIDKPKPCPFCGSEIQEYPPSFDDEKFPRKSVLGYYVICAACGAQLTQLYKFKNEGINWNTRPIEDKLSAQLSKSEKEGDDLAKELSDLEIEKDQLFEEALAYKSRAEKAEAMVERLIEAGEFLAENYREQWNLDDEHPSTWRWDAAVDEWNQSKKAEAE